MISLLTAFQSYLNLKNLPGENSVPHPGPEIQRLISKRSSLPYWRTVRKAAPSSLGLAVTVVTLCLEALGAVLQPAGGFSRLVGEETPRGRGRGRGPPGRAPRAPAKWGSPCPGQAVGAKRGRRAGEAEGLRGSRLPLIVEIL